MQFTWAPQFRVTVRGKGGEWGTSTTLLLLLRTYGLREKNPRRKGRGKRSAWGWKEASSNPISSDAIT